MTESMPVSTWTVDSQIMRTKVVSPGNVQEGYEISFHTGNGHAGTVFVPETKYTPANVKAVIAAQAAQMDAVGNLTSDS